MKGRTDPSCPDYTRPSDAEERRAEYLTGNGRRASLKTPTYYTLKALDIGVAGKTIDLASMPLKTVDGECVLDLERVEAELLRTGKQAPSLSTIAVSDAVACIMFDLAVNEAGIDDGIFSGGDVEVVAANMGRLVGHLVPVFSQVRPTVRARDAACKTKKRKVSELNMDPIQPLGDGGALPRKAHAFAMQPVQLSTVGTHGQGMFLAGGVIVSNKCFNYPEGDPKRVGTGRNPAFEETICWMLITHSYEGLTYAAVGPPSTKTVRTAEGVERVEVLDTPGRNTLECVFRWRAFMVENLEDGRRAGVSAFGFTDIKQTGKDTTRRILPWTIEDVTARLASMRNLHDLSSYLRDLPMKAMLNYEVDLGNRPVGGMDLRRMLLIELLLTGTPLEGLQRGPDAADRALALPAPPKVPGGAAGLYDRLKAFCDAVYS